jgi:hypothetical protein
MDIDDIAAWQGFFGVLAQVGATLAGLLFVGLTISLQHLIGARGYLSRGFTALSLQFEILVIGIFGLVPQQSTETLGVEFIVTGAAVLAGTQAFARNFPEDENSKVLSGTVPRVIRAVLIGISTLAPVVAGVSLINAWLGALYWLVPAAVAAIYLSIGYAWIFAVEIPRRADQDSKDV